MRATPLTLAIAARWLSVLGCIVLASCGPPARRLVIGPPPPPGAVPAPEMRVEQPVTTPTTQRERKPVLALMRAGDTEALREVLPFGPQRSRMNPYHPDFGTPNEAGPPVLLPPEVRQYLMRELLEAGEFVVLERERILEIIRELEFAESRYVDADSVKRTGKLYGVHFIIEAAYFPPADAAAGEGAYLAEPPCREVRTDHSAVYLDVFDVEASPWFAGSDRIQPSLLAAVDELVSKLASATPPIAVQEVGEPTTFS